VTASYYDQEGPEEGNGLYVVPFLSTPSPGEVWPHMTPAILYIAVLSQYTRIYKNERHSEKYKW
jgi:hypothetical protein